MSTEKISKNMYRRWKTFLGVVLIFFMFAGFAFGAEVLLVVGKRDLRGVDLTIQEILKNRGHSVIVLKDEAVRSEDVCGKDLVIISDSVLALHVNSKFRECSVPVICSDPWLFDDLGMTAKVKLKDFGRRHRQQNIKIINPKHPLAAYYSGEIMVSSKAFFMGWGIPGKKAIRVATLKQDPGKCPIFAYEAGADMPGCVAPARRVGFFLSKDAGESITPEGWFLFNAVVDWAISDTENNVPDKMKSDKS